MTDLYGCKMDMHQISSLFPVQYREKFSTYMFIPNRSVHVNLKYKLTLNITKPIRKKKKNHWKGILNQTHKSSYFH